MKSLIKLFLIWIKNITTFLEINFQFKFSIKTSYEHHLGYYTLQEIFFKHKQYVVGRCYSNGCVCVRRCVCRCTRVCKCIGLWVCSTWYKVRGIHSPSTVCLRSQSQWHLPRHLARRAAVSTHNAVYNRDLTECVILSPESNFFLLFYCTFIASNNYSHKDLFSIILYFLTL